MNAVRSHSFDLLEAAEQRGPRRDPAIVAPVGCSPGNLFPIPL